MPRFVYALSGALAFAALATATPIVRMDDDPTKQAVETMTPVTVAVTTGTAPVVASAGFAVTTAKPIAEPAAETSSEPEAETSTEPSAETSSEPEVDNAGGPGLEASTEAPATAAAPERPSSGCGECAEGLVCTPTPWVGPNTSDCLAKPPACYPAGERNIGAPNKTYVPFARCCDGQESVARPGDYGRFCPSAPAADTAAPVPAREPESPTSVAATTEAPVGSAPIGTTAAPVDSETQPSAEGDAEPEATAAPESSEKPEAESEDDGGDASGDDAGEGSD